MKKFGVLILAMLMALSLTACSKSEAATQVDEMIGAIGTVTLESIWDIEAAEAAFAALEEKDSKQVDQASVLAQARASYEALVLEAQIAQVQDAIAAIGTVTLESESNILAARSAYDTADAPVQSGVENLSQLEAAEAQLNELRVSAVQTLIDAIGEVSLESGGAIQTAEKALAALPDVLAVQVNNQSILEAAQQAHAQLKETLGKEALATLTSDYDNVQGITWYKSPSEPYYADTRSYVLPYIGQNSSSTWLRLCYHYTGDDWVFFTKLTLVVDGEKYYRSFAYRDVDRDNQYGNVWEWMDVEPSQSDIDMLRAIAASDETIVRFEGDIHHYDLTIGSKDKSGITAVLDAYEALK